MRSVLKALGIALVIAVLALFFTGSFPKLAGFFSRNIPKEISTGLAQFDKNTLKPALQNLQKQILAPTPLRLQTNTTAGVLTVSGVIADTNAERAKAGAKALTENAVLDASANLKLKDLFAKQYFAHVSPSGVGPSDLAVKVGYDYIMIGENLALGNFKDNEDLLLAWMNSPGHRANILNVRYSEIGVAVGKGMYEGEETWIAVQEFGLPASACPSPSAVLENKIKNERVELDALSTELETKKADIENTDRSDPSYNQKVREYNALVADYNDLVSQTKLDIATYNGEVNVSNVCRQS